MSDKILQVRTSLHRKCPSYDCLLKLTNKNEAGWLNISETVLLPTDTYTDFTENLTDDHNWLLEKKGTLLVTDGTRFIVVEPEGYNYARYSGLVLERKEL